MRLIPVLVLSIIPLHANPNLPIDAEDGCLTGPMAQFGQYLGQWDIRDYQLSQDGTWEEQAGAAWNFTCIGNGIAVQDFWLPADGGVGTNLRIYDPEKKVWDITWTSTGTPGMSHIQAHQQANGNIEMSYVTPIPQPNRRITFFPADENHWRWKLEISSDGDKTWLEVYRIEASRAKKTD